MLLVQNELRISKRKKRPTDSGESLNTESENLRAGRSKTHTLEEVIEANGLADKV